MPIQLLPEDVAARIAAGEVVERPASVVKELMENSLDAGATRVEVETRDGGKQLVRVLDNGVGIPPDEVELAFRRHATSKLERAVDLQRIATLGFRGEALASIASVSRLTCTTRHPDHAAGVRLRVEGGSVISRRPIGRPDGTEMVVEDLFYNVPARRKFLRTERTERRHIDSYLTRYAIAYPEVAFHVVHDGREVLRTPGNRSPREVLLEVYGLDLGSSLLEIPEELTAERPIRVRGFVGPTTVHRADRGYVTLFINGRWVQDLRIGYAIIQAYHTLLPTKRYPVAFVMVEMPAEDVDVNVHPAKAEVRFRDGDTVFRAVQRAVRTTVIEEAPAAAAWRPAGPGEGDQARPTESGGSPTPASAVRARLANLKPAQQFHLPEGERGEGPSGPTAPPSTATPDMTTRSEGASLPPLRVIGQAATTFIIAEGPEGLYLIDQHAAHERVLYERLLKEWAEGEVAAQPLLEPVSVELPPDEAQRLEERLDALHKLGLHVEPFGPSTFLIRALPAPLGQISPQELLADIAASEMDRSPIREGLEELTVRKICKRAAIKAGQVLSQEEMMGLVRQLEATRNPRTCPHGRPTVLQISVEQLAAQFHRV
jgi:DNA mismatch repair protein MutL